MLFTISKSGRILRALCFAVLPALLNISGAAASTSVGPPVSPMVTRILSNTGNPKEIPVPVYHCVSSDVWGVKSMFVSPASFEEQIRYLKNHGYTAITFRDLSNVKSVRRPVMITFDDGYEDNYTNAYPILKKYGFKATVFLIAGIVNSPRFLNAEEISKMQDIIDFESHTMTHKHLTELDSSKMDSELSESKRRLEKTLGNKVTALAYPFGDYNSKVIEATKKYYKYAVTTNYGKYYYSGKNSYEIKRINILDKTDLKEFAKWFK